MNREASGDGPPGRRPLAWQGGPAEGRGDPDAAARLVRALEEAATVDPDAWTHPFHAYPARLHPGIARAGLALAAEVGAGGPVLDPFCGSGTVLVEARAAGWEGTGVDLDPLALRLAEVKAARPRPGARARFRAAAEAVATASEERVRGRVPVVAPVSRELARAWDGHVLKELGGLREEIRAVEEDRVRRALEVVLSAIVGKFSRRRADTSGDEAPRRIRKGLSTEFFLRKCRELEARWAEYEAAVPDGAPPPALVGADARRLRDALGPVRFPLVLTSPPYGGTYDYVAHHALRHPWLGLDPAPLARGEIGARRAVGRDPRGAERWRRELSDALRSTASVLAPGGVALLVLGDARHGDRVVDAHRQVAALAPGAGLRLVAGAAQPRPDWRGGAPRREHLLWLDRPAPVF